MKKNWIFITLTSLFLFASLALSAATWEPPVTLSSGAASSTPKIVCSDQGYAAVEWVSGGNVYTAYCAPNGTWEVETLHGPAKDFALAYDETSNLTLVWIEDGAPDQVKGGYRGLGGPWQATPGSIATGTTLEAIQVEAISTNKQALATWVDTDGTGTVSSLYRSGGGLSWAGVTQTINPVGYTADTKTKPLLQLKPNGNATVVSRLNNGGTNDLFQSTSSGGGSWSATPTNLNFTSSLGTEPDTFAYASNSKGDSIVIARKTVGGQMATAVEKNSSWSSFTQLNNQTADTPSAGIDSKGQATVVCKNTSGLKAVESATTNVQTVSWKSTTVANKSSAPALNVNSSENMVTAFKDSENQAVAKTGFAGTFQNTVSVLDSEEASTQAETVSINKSGTAFATWRESGPSPMFTEGGKTPFATVEAHGDGLVRASRTIAVC